MKAGKLSHRIEIYTVSLTTDSEGGFTSTETLKATVYAQIRQLSMSETTTSGQVVGENNFEIMIRRESINSFFNKTYILKWMNKRLNITSIITNEFYFIINATERDSIEFTSLTINNGDALPVGATPDQLYIDTGIIEAPEFGYPDLKTYLISTVDGYRFVSLSVYYPEESETITSISFDGVDTLFVINTANVDFGVLLMFIKI